MFATAISIRAMKRSGHPPCLFCRQPSVMASKAPVCRACAIHELPKIIADAIQPTDIIPNSGQTQSIFAAWKEADHVFGMRILSKCKNAPVSRPVEPDHEYNAVASEPVF